MKKKVNEMVLVEGNGTVNSFYISKYEVTQGEYSAVMGKNPSNFKGESLPVETVSWYDAIEYCNKRSENEGLTPAYTYTKEADNNLTNVAEVAGANGYRLPHENEWEYAAKGGNKSMGYTYSGSNTIGDVAWYWGNNETNGEIYGTKAVGRKQANELGIYDMTGNVWEWCWDWHPSYVGSTRMIRGGSWGCDGGDCAVRSSDDPFSRDDFLGFRVLRTCLEEEDKF